MKKHIIFMNDNEEWLPVEGCIVNDNPCSNDEVCEHDDEICSINDIVVISIPG